MKLSIWLSGLLVAAVCHVPALAAVRLRPPAIPAHGAYLGAWVNPMGLGADPNGETAAKEIGQLAAFNKAVGRPVAILHAFSGFSDPVPIRTLMAIENNGSIPLLDWHCANVADVAAGRYDRVIGAYARDIRSFGRPLFLRWYWEMNGNNPHRWACGGFDNGPTFIAAWRHIRTMFIDAGATNAAFVWCPGGRGDVSAYYPGDAYVDWIGADKYDHALHDKNAFASMFGDFFSALASHGKPLMIGETGAKPQDQVAFIRGIARDVPTKFPQIKAIVFFDAPGKRGDWSLQGAGMTAFRALAAEPYFSFRGRD